MKESNDHVTNINRLLQSIKSDIKVDFIWSEQLEVTIIINKVVSSLDLQMIKRYVKNIKHVITKEVEVPYLLQSKSYLKIIDIPYLKENTNTSITADVVEDILKNNYIFNNITLASRLQVIKISPKFNMGIIWIDIWDVQSSSNVKELINRCFNVESYITTIRDTNMNSGIP